MSKRELHPDHAKRTITWRPGVNVEQRERVKTCEHPGCGVSFRTRAANRRFCDDHSPRVRMTGRG
jgi:hypothetical protein